MDDEEGAQENTNEDVEESSNDNVYDEDRDDEDVDKSSNDEYDKETKVMKFMTNKVSMKTAEMMRTEKNVNMRIRTIMMEKTTTKMM